MYMFKRSVQSPRAYSLINIVSCLIVSAPPSTINHSTHHTNTHTQCYMYSTLNYTISLFNIHGRHDHRHILS